MLNHGKNITLYLIKGVDDASRKILHAISEL